MLLLNAIFEYFNWPIYINHLRDVPSSLWQLLIEDVLQIKFKGNLDQTQSIQMMLDFLEALTQLSLSHIDAKMIVKKDVDQIKYLNDVICAVIMDIYPQLRQYESKSESSVSISSSIPSTGRKRVEKTLSETSDIPTFQEYRDGPVASALKARNAIRQLRNAARDEKLAQFHVTPKIKLLRDQWRSESVRIRNEKHNLQ
eukprot:NODE_1_length_95616_cov_0.657642.p54 type:complete len:199 gc:universal NODE_1_length_95616_cov_0.657642:46447-47043(+)